MYTYIYNVCAYSCAYSRVVVVVVVEVVVVVVAEAFLGVRAPQNLRLNQHKLRSAR